MTTSMKDSAQELTTLKKAAFARDTVAPGQASVPTNSDAWLNHPGGSTTAGSGAAVHSVPLPASVLLRHRARAVASIDAALSTMNKQYAKLKRRRESLSWPIRKVLMRENVAQMPLDEDAFLASVAVQEESKIHPARIVRYDGLAKLFPVRPTQIVVKLQRGKRVPRIRSAQKSAFPRVCPVCMPDAPAPYFVAHCAQHGGVQ